MNPAFAHTSATHTQTPSSQVPTAVRLAGVGYCWPGSNAPLRFPELELATGEHLFVEGPSGCGKSTLLSLLGGLIVASEGSVQVLGSDPAALSARGRDRIRADHLGVIFQQFNLIPYLSVLANVLLPCRLSVRRQKQLARSAETEAGELLSALGLDQAFWQRPVTRLSVGQQQRVAAARALIGNPGLILADEPTSALDTGHRDRFIDLLLSHAGQRGASVVLVSHDPALSTHFHRRLSLEAAS